MVAVYPQELDVVLFCEFRYAIYELSSFCVVNPIAEVATSDDVGTALFLCFCEDELCVSELAVYVACEQDALSGEIFVV